MRSIFRQLSLATVTAVAAMVSATADDAPFLGTDPVSVLGTKEALLQQWLDWNSGQTGASFNAFESQTEFDYGLTDRLQLALTMVYNWSRTHPPGQPAIVESLPGLAAEAIYILAPTHQSPIGIALAVDPAFNARSRGVAVRLLLEKYLWGFENVLNIAFEDDWDKDDTGHWTGSSGIAFNYGLAHAIGHNWTVALELGNTFAFDNLLSDGHFRALTNTFFLGPTIEYECAAGVLTFGVQAQMPWSSGNNTAGGYTTDAERWRIGLRLTRAI